MSRVDSNTTTSTEVVNKEHKNFIGMHRFITSYSISFHSMIIKGPGQYDYHGFTIITNSSPPHQLNLAKPLVQAYCIEPTQICKLKQTSQLTRFDRETHGFGPLLTVSRSSSTLSLSLDLARLTHGIELYPTARLNQTLMSTHTK